MPAASSSSGSTVKLPSYSRFASVTVARWIFALSISRNISFHPGPRISLRIRQLLDDLRNFIMPGGLVRRVGQRTLAGKAGDRDVVAHHVLEVEHMGRRFDALCVQPVQR